MLKYVVNRLKEPSTWRGVVLILTAAGITLSPEQATAVVTVGLAIAGAIGAFVPDSK